MCTVHSSGYHTPAWPGLEPGPRPTSQVHCYAPLSIKSLEEIDDEHLLSKPAFK